MDAEQGRTALSVHSPAHTRSSLRRRRHTLAAWERFVAGDDDVQGIPPSILLSWYRCRDVHKVDPRLPRPPAVSGRTRQRLVHGGVYAQLGGIASSIVEHDKRCLATVTDGEGQILAAWGTQELRQCAADSNLAPFFAWSESVTGTNGMGTAIMQQQPVLVRGPEHWCQALHEWTCVGVAVYDAVTQVPVAALNISSRLGDEVPVLANRLAVELGPVRAGLREQALQDGIEVSRAFMEADRHSRGKLLAVDVAGNIIAANDETRTALGDLPKGFMLDPASRRDAGLSQLRSAVAQSCAHLQEDPRWVGSVEIGSALVGRAEMFSLAPVNSPGGVVGWILSSNCDGGDGEALPGAAADPVPQSDRSGRIAAVDDGNVLLLDPSEIRYAESDRHVVWLTTDIGRMRAATRGMDNLEKELAPFGFLRVHRSYLVNIDRIRKVSPKGKGVIVLSTDVSKTEQIPVSRRSATELRGILRL